MAQSEADPPNARSQWNPGKVTALIGYLYHHCAQHADSGNLRMATYNMAAITISKSTRWP
ncbi:hypothetical protein PAXRUDRAFT_165936 [Paxillus rubicundulus Ve08.2h10]|uniref:Uncharacterized protein n=1 Tax=Paxillus rubicundulus Ve08.2h10 TaxID=930991 RepID=A0A0D0D2F7_9AGAM|nr:hypothetical protein PAXRUDRAFT_165936 [Paxillus rubicundulus Ve08.2h10]